MGYVVFFGPHLISQRSKKQPTVSKPSTEAEYRSIVYVVAETIWIYEVLHDIAIALSAPVRLYCDNVNAMYMTAKPVQHDRSKHIAVIISFANGL